MARDEWANNASTTLASGINSSVTELTVATGDGALFDTPTEGYYATLEEDGVGIEIVRVTAKSTDTFTITRAQQGTTAKAFTTAATFEQRETAASFDRYERADDFLDSVAYAAAEGVAVGTSADQASNFTTFFDDIVAATGDDRGIAQLPPGLIRVDTNIELELLDGYVIRGAGYSRNNGTGGSPRQHGSVETGGTYLYWDGTDGETVFTLDRCTFLHFADFAISLEAAASSSDKAAVGVEVIASAAGHGSGSHFFENVMVSLLSTEAGSVAWKYGDPASPTGPQCDTTLFVNCMVNLIETGFHHHNDQSVEFVHVAPRFRACSNWWKFDQGGVLHVFGAIAQDDVSSHDTILCYVGNGSTNLGTYNIFGAYIDRQGTDQFTSIFDMGEDTINTQMYAVGVRLNPMTSGATFDGSERGVLEARPGAQQTLDSCMCNDQPMVRWRNSYTDGTASDAELDRDALVVIRGGYVADRLFGSELVTTLEGGYAGRVRFDGVRKGGGNTTRMYDVWVNDFPMEGSSRTFYDPDDFDDVNGTAWANTWLGGGKASSPAWSVLGYYPMREAVGSTTLTDRVGGSANDLTVHADVQSLYPPIPYDDQWADWSQHTDNGEDTGISFDTTTDDFFLFCILQLVTAGGSGGTVAQIDASGGDIDILRNGSSSNLNLVGGSETFLFTASLLAPIAVVVTIDQSTDTAKIFGNGVKVKEIANCGYANRGSGNLYIGGRNGTGQWLGYLSRVGFGKAYLTDQEATILSNQMTVIARRIKHRP